MISSHDYKFNGHLQQTKLDVGSKIMVHFNILVTVYFAWYFPHKLGLSWEIGIDGYI